jgi:transposase
MFDPNLLPDGFSISEEDLRNTPPAVLLLLTYLIKQNIELKARIEELEARLNKNSTNSSKPPSSDNKLMRKDKTKNPRGKSGAKKGHKGVRQQLLKPTKVEPIEPHTCSCGNTEFKNKEPYYTHQWIEVPEIALFVTHYVLYRGTCTRCGTVNKSVVPESRRTGFGPRLSSIIAEMDGNQGDSRSLIQNFCLSVLGLPISLGAIQKVLDRASVAIEPHYEAIASETRKAPVNHVDESFWFTYGSAYYLWLMASKTTAFFRIDKRRTKQAFRALIKDWEGILISDGYAVYTDWAGLRQTCLAHLIRDARAISERQDKDLARFGAAALAELTRLCHMAHEPPTIGQWRMFYARFTKLIVRNHGRKDEAGVFAARLLREINSLWVFLEQEGVAPTNNHAERLLRFAVCWRKRSFGTQSEKGNRWVERILSLRQTCRLRSVRTFPVLVEALESYFTRRAPDLAWIDHEASTL